MISGRRNSTVAVNVTDAMIGLAPLMTDDYKNMAQIGPDSPPQALGHREHSSGQRGQVRLGKVRVGLL